MKLLELFQKYNLAIHYLTLIVFVAGIVCLYQMRREARPNVNFNRVSVSAAYPGASPSDIEELVIAPIEEKIAEVDGIKEYRSVSFVGAGSISIKIDDSYSDTGAIVDELRRKISEVKGLPDGVDDPRVTEAKATNIPVLSMALYGDVKPETFKIETEKLKDFLQKQPGVQSVSSSGISNLQIKILADKDKLNKYDMTLNEVINTLSQWSKQKPGGLFENSDQVANITIGRDLNEIESLEEFVIRGNDSGRKVRLKDVGDIQYRLESTQTSSLYKDQEAVLFTVIKKPFSDSIQVVDDLNRSLEKFNANINPKLMLEIYNDQSIRIRNKLSIVSVNAITGLILVIIVLLIFLDWRSSFVTSIGIPVAILGGICVLYAMGHTLNSLVVVGMIIVLGMLVDDAIVVCENIYSFIEKGFSPKEAAIRGTHEIALPVIASVLTTVFGFLPIVYMGDIIGQFLRVIPITVIALLSISLIEALLVLPVHAEEFMRKKKKKKHSFFKKIEDIYKKYLVWSIRHKFKLTTVLVIFFAFSAFQGEKIFERFSLFPSEGLDGLSVRLELPKNTPVATTKKATKELSRLLLENSENTFDNIISNVGQVTTGGSGGSRQSGANLAMINVNFTSDPSFTKKEKQVLKNIRKTIKEYTKDTDIKASITLDRPGPPVGKPIQLQVTSRDFSVGEEVVEKIKTELKTYEGVNSLETDLDGDSVKYRLVVNNELAVSEGVDPDAVSRTIFASSTGRVASEILKNNEKIEIQVTAKKAENEPITQLMQLKVRNRNGQAVPIRAFVKVETETGPSSIQRLNGLRTITLFGEVDENLISGKQANKKIKPFIAKLRKNYPSITIITGGGEVDRLKAVKETLTLYLFAMGLIFIIISLTFNSIFYPFLVLTTVPMGLSGVIWSLVVHGKSLTIMGVIGIVGLSGVVVNVSIILLKFIQNRLREGASLKDSVVEAGVTRLRPIVMTTISTLIGLLPTIYGIGGVDTFVQPIALVLGWGLFVSTLLALLFLPAFICIFTRLDSQSGRTKAEI